MNWPLGLTHARDNVGEGFVSPVDADDVPSLGGPVCAQGSDPGRGGEAPGKACPADAETNHHVPPVVLGGLATDDELGRNVRPEHMHDPFWNDAHLSRTFECPDKEQTGD